MAPMIGIVTIVFALLLSRKLGWNAAPARIPLLIAAVLFGFAILFPTIAVSEGDTAWLIAGFVALAIGALVLVIAVLQFQQIGHTSPLKPDAERGKRHRKPKKQATTPPESSEPDATDDPHAGPHGA